MGSFFTSTQKQKSADPFPVGSIDRATWDDLLLDTAERRKGGGINPMGGGYGGSVMRGAMGDYANVLGANEQRIGDIFSGGLGGIQDTLAGKYLDPMQSAAFRRFAESTQRLGDSAYSGLVDNIAERTAARGNYTSSARLNQENAAAGKVAENVANTIAQAGFNQYGAERGYQNQANTLAAMLPGDLYGRLASMGAAEREAFLREIVTGQSLESQRIRDQIAALSLGRRGGGETQNTPSPGEILGGVLQPSLTGGGS